MNKETPPDIFLFNPTGEMAIAHNRPSYQPPALMAGMEQALSALPGFIARDTDIVMCHKIPPSGFIQFWEDLNLKLPQMLPLTSISTNLKFIQQDKAWIRPWCWSPDAHRLFSPLYPSCSAEFQNSPNGTWNEAKREAYSRSNVHKILANLPNTPNDISVLREEYWPVIAKSISEVEKILQNWNDLVIKSPWSSSGRGIQILRNGQMETSHKQWMQGVLSLQGFVMVEYLFNKVADFSLQFDLQKNKAQPLGFTHFETTSNGTYLGTHIGKKFEPQSAVWSKMLLHLPQLEINLSIALEKSGLSDYYNGPMGIDLLVYTDTKGEHKIHPCLEVNLRPTMGLVALTMTERIHPLAQGSYHTFFNKKRNFKLFLEELQQQNPPQTRDGLIYSGIFPMTPTIDTPFGAYLNLQKG